VYGVGSNQNFAGYTPPRNVFNFQVLGPEDLLLFQNGTNPDSANDLPASAAEVMLDPTGLVASEVWSYDPYAPAPN
jgi:hypothetical protein